MLSLLISIILILIGYLFYKKFQTTSKSNANIVEHDDAIVIGGSIGGMVTAVYLSKYFKRITIIESDDVLNEKLMKSTADELLDYRCRLESPVSLGRSGVSQMYQIHALIGEGVNILRELFPELESKLINEYNVRNYSLKSESQFTINGVLLNKDLTEDLKWFCIDRFTLEIVLRKEIYSKFQNQIQWKTNSKVTELIVDKSLNLVKGVRYRTKENNQPEIFDLYGDFIVDCTGKNSSSIKWLKQCLDLNVPSEEIHFGIGYVTFIGERFQSGNSSYDSMSIIGTTTNAPSKNTACSIVPIREIKSSDSNSLGTLSTILVNCVNNEYPPNDSYENLLNWVREHTDEQHYFILKSTKPCSPLLPYRHAIDKRNYSNLLGKKWPQNYILLGDALCAFNPQYGQGMTHACRQARLLKEIFYQNSHNLKNISHIFNSKASIISDECWLVATVNDWKTPTLKVVKTDKYGQTKTYFNGDQSTFNKTNCEAKPPLLIQFLQWYFYWFLICASTSGKLSTDFLKIMNQYQSPFILLKPITFLTVCYTAFKNYL